MSAFPHSAMYSKPTHSPSELPDIPQSCGMSLRDYFAAKAMQSMISMREVILAIQEDKLTVMEITGASYQWADAMLAVREKQP